MSSKIKVDTIENVAGSGNVSLGSGHNLVVPGNITGQGTTTLTGNLTVDTNTLHVDTSNNRVGIGTASPSHELSIVGTNARMELLSAVGGTSIFDMGTTSNTDLASIRYASGTGSMTFRTNDAVRMTIDSNGYVLKPNTPAFNARSHSSSTGTSAFYLGSTNNSQTSVVIYNNGSHFNNTNGRFTAPVAGIYYFGCQASPSQGANSGIYIIKNGGSQLSGTAYQYSTSYNGSAVSAIVSLAANEYVQGVMMPFNGTTEGQYDGNFCGALIG